MEWLLDSTAWLVDFTTSEKARNLALVAGVVIATVSVATARSIARKKQSADLLFSSRNDTNLQDGCATIGRYHNSDEHNMRSLADREKFYSDDARSVRYVLNHFESLAVGIRAGIYDETMIKECWHGLLVDTFTKTEPLILAIREKKGVPTALQEFEWLAARWKKSPLKRRRVVHVR